MQGKWMLLAVVLATTCLVNTTSSLESGSFNSTEKTLSRRKRYIVFPKGSSLQLAIELLPEVPEAPNEIVVGPTVAVAWQLPTEAAHFIKEKFKREKRGTKKHGKLQANRFGAFKNFKTILDLHEINGKECILRALCESGQRTPSKKPFVHEILYKIFSLESGEEVDEEYLWAHNLVNSNCASLYPDCPFSLFNLGALTQFS